MLCAAVRDASRPQQKGETKERSLTSSNNFHSLTLMLGHPQFKYHTSCHKPTTVLMLAVLSLQSLYMNKCKKLQFIHKLTMSDTSKTAKSQKNYITHQHIA